MSHNEWRSQVLTRVHLTKASQQSMFRCFASLCMCMRQCLPCAHDRGKLLEVASTICCDHRRHHGNSCQRQLDTELHSSRYGAGCAAPTAATPTSPLQILLQKVLDGEVPIHESRLPVLQKQLTAMVCSAQRGLKLSPVGLRGAGPWKQKTNC